MYCGPGFPGAYRASVLLGRDDSLFTDRLQQERTTTFGLRGAFTHKRIPTGTRRGPVLGLAFAIQQRQDPCLRRRSPCMNGRCPSRRCGGGTPTSTTALSGLITLDPCQEPDFSADLAWGTLTKIRCWDHVCCPGMGSTAKPAANLRDRDSNAAPLLLRAQRNW